MSEDIPEDIKDFLRRFIRSIVQLDILCLLNSNSAVSWSAEGVSAELRTNISQAQNHLRDLSMNGLISEHTADQYSCCANDMTIKLISTYNLRRTAVIHFIYSQPMDSIQTFADAFKIKKDGGH